ncbi:MAG TPA: hypothetical protein VK581_09145 [Chthoniobacterales bacterium]|nr:hypothetical protein [Chthoniobacterales bacterium]
MASSEMLYVSGSSSAQFDEKASALRAADNIVAAVVAGASTLLDTVPEYVI